MLPQVDDTGWEKLASLTARRKPARRPRYDRDAVFNPDGLPVWADRHRLEGTVASHEHDFLEIALVTQGTAVHLSPVGDRPIRSGSAVIVAPGEWHGYARCSNLVVFDCFVGPELMDGALAFLQHQLPLLRTLQQAGPQLVAVPQVQLGRADLSRCVAELHGITDTVRKQRSLTAVVGHLLIYLDILDQAWQSRRDTYTPDGPRQHPAALQAAEAMEADLAHAWTLGELASRLALERTYLVRVFRNSIGVPPIAYLNRRRAQEASALLVRSDQPIAAVGAQVGWGEPAYFARRFRSFFGLSPSAYRRRAMSGIGHHHRPGGADVPLPVSGARYGGTD